MASKAQLREGFREGAARHLAQAVSPGAEPLVHSSLSDYFAYFESDSELIVAAPDDTRLLGDVDRALALGLGYAGSRPLALVLPAGHAEHSRLRASCITTPIAIYEYEGTAVDRVAIPDVESATELAATWGTVAATEQEQPAHSFAKGADWVVDLIDWVMTRRVETVSRTKYLAWHFRGRQVLKLERTGDGFHVYAGVQYKKPPADQPQPISRRFSLSAPPSDQALQQVREAVDRAVENRRKGLDGGHQEHALQEAIRNQYDGFGLTGWTREFPAARPGSKRAFIDYIGVDDNDALHVVETKIGPDYMLVLQGLDYWLWVSGNNEAIARQFGVGRLSGVIIDFVLGRAQGKSLLHPLNPPQAAALSSQVVWRFHDVTNWRDGGVPTIHSWAEREVPTTAELVERAPAEGHSHSAKRR